VCVVLADRVAGILTLRARMTMVGVLPETTGMTLIGAPYPSSSRRRPGSREPPCGLVLGHPPGIPAYAGMTQGRQHHRQGHG